VTTTGGLTAAVARVVWPLPALAALAFGASEIAWSTGGRLTKDAVVLGLINLTLVVGIYVFVGNSGIISFGHAAFAAIGAYTAGLLAIAPETKAVLQPTLPALLANAYFGSIAATLIGGAVAAAVAAALALPLMRLGGIAAGLATFALLVIARTVANNWDAVTNGAAGLSGVPTTTTKNVALVWALIALGVAFAFQISGCGLRLRASREDEVAARSIGVSVRHERRSAWIVSAFLAGIGGALYGQYLGSFNADAFYTGLTFTTLAMLVVGGMTSLTGAVIGSLAISFLAEFLDRIEQGVDLGLLHTPARPGLREVALALLMIGCLIVRPAGLTNGRELPWPQWPPMRMSRRKETDQAVSPRTEIASTIERRR
jgi:branched-chain amino acid transport system permease protein